MNTTHCCNAFSDRVILDATQSGIIAAIWSAFIPLIIIINSSLAYALYKNKLLNSRSRWYVFLLTLSDCGYSVTIVLLVALFTTFRKVEFCSLEYTTIFLMQFNVNTSICLILLIAFHRYLKIRPDLKSRTYNGAKQSVMSGGLANILVAMSFVLPLFHGLASNYFFGYFRTRIPLICTKVISCIAVLTVYILYFRLYYRITHKHTRPVDDVSESSQQQTRLYPTAFTKTVFLLLIALSVSFLPFFVMDVWTSWYTHLMGDRSPQSIRFTYYLTCVFMSSICCSDGIIFIYRNKTVREYLSLANCLPKPANTKQVSIQNHYQVGNGARIVKHPFDKPEKTTAFEE